MKGKRKISWLLVIMLLATMFTGIQLISPQKVMATSAPTMNTPVAGANKADLSWSTVSGATYYTVKGGTTSGVYNMFYKTADATVTSYTYSGLTSGTPYYFVVSAVDAGGESLNSNEVTVTPLNKILAFPGAEGGGRNTSGGRGYDIYEVTNLNDSGAGSLRDAVSQGNRTIVFKVSGIINLQSRLKILGSNITIAGQTAPGDGICVAGYDTQIADGLSNIIIRYMRFRPGDANINAEPDGIWGRKLTDVILDHISSGWSTDESLSFYGNTNFTLQWSLVSESLTMSGHFKGKHGYGGIWGGSNATFHHNILAHHTSRNSRIEVGGNTTPASVDLRNNIIYDWQFNSTYGGDASSVNIVNNYYKPGPMTNELVKSRIANPGFPGNWYLSGNYMFGDAAVTADNNLGYQPDATAGATKVTTPIAIEGISSITTQTAENAFNSVLAKAGATFPKRDSVDARVTSDIKNGTGRAINRPYEVGGYPIYNTAAAPTDTDHDGMPDSWEDSHGLNKNDAADGKVDSGDGYTNLEKYLNSLVDMNYEAANPTVSISSPVLNSLHATSGNIQITADAVASSGAAIAKVEFYKNDVKLGEATSAPYSYTWTNIPEGTYYISAKAIDSNGLATQSSPVAVHINNPTVGAPWTSTDIGSVGIAGSASLDGSGVMTVKGSGTLIGTSDTFQYTYQALNGDGELSAKIDSIANIEQDAGFSGIMIREDLSPDSPHALLGAVHVKATNLSTSTAIEFIQRAERGGSVSVLNPPSSTVAGYTYDNGLYNIAAPYWIKLSRFGKDISAYVSKDGATWDYLGTRSFASLPNSIYIGFAVDAGKSPNKNENYNYANFSNIVYNTTAAPVMDFVVTKALDAEVNNAAATIAGHFTVGADVVIKLNGTVILNSTHKAANEELTQDITLAEGTNQIEITATDAQKNTRIFTYSTVYKPTNNGGTVINNRKIDVWDFGGVPASGELYNNNITASTLEAATTVKSGTFVTTAFGDLLIANPVTSDRMYYYKADGSVGTNSYGTWGSSAKAYSDGYSSNGTFYCNGTGGNTRRYLTINNVAAGDKITIYGGLSASGPEQIHFVHAGISVTGNTVTVTPDTTQVQDTTATFSAASKIDFVAKYSGSYQIYVTALAGGKPYFHRVVRTPGVIINGKVNFNGADKTGVSLTFKNQTTGDLTDVSINADNTFSTILAAGYSYTAALKGTLSYAVSDTTKIVSTTTSEIPYGKNNINFDVVVNNIVTITGKIGGFDSGYDTSKFSFKFTPPTDSLAEVVSATVDTSTMLYTADIKADQAYTVVISGVNDYEVVSGGSVNINANTTQDIAVAKKAVYTTTGNFVGLSPTAAVQSIKFTNLKDGYVYNGTVVNGGYTASLRDGDYSVTAVCSEGYTTMNHIVVNGQNTTKDIRFTAPADTSPLNWVSDLYVGDSSKSNNYSTVKEALAAAARMMPATPSEANRITIHIAPGVYRAQLKITTPYITLVNSDPSNEVKITWYYGIGYDYYSAGADGFYNEDRAFDKYAKNNVGNGKWGATVFLTSTAKEFKAENIVFENSFNKYMTSEELEDGVQVTTTSTPTITTIRKATTDATAKSSTERAAAMGIEADNVEFNNCKFLSSQDTLYTGGSNVSQYYKNCFIEGNTDYIFGDGDAVFDDCTLNFFGYTDNAVGGYITAAKDQAAHGYLFRNCTVTANAKNLAAPGYFGRPWGPLAKVTFLNTKLQNATIIDPKGWTDMSGATPENNPNYYEYNTTYNGVKVDTSLRRVKDKNVNLLSDTAAGAISESNYFGAGWTPKYYTANSDTAPTFITVPFLTSSGDINLPYPGDILTLGYEFTNNNDNLNDSSLIQWYRVGPDGTETLINVTTAYISKTYKITSLDSGAYIKAVVASEVVNGKKGAAMSIQLDNLVRASLNPIPTWIDASLTASNVTTTGLTLTWSTASDDTGITGYKVYQGSTLIKTVDGSLNSTDVSGLTEGTEYTFTVQAGNKADKWTEDGPSTTVKTKVAQVPDTTPTWTDASLTASNVTTTGLTLTWSTASDDTGITGYKVYQGSTLIKTVDGSVYGTDVSGLTAGTEYTFTVQAGDKADKWTEDGPSTTVKTKVAQVPDTTPIDDGTTTPSGTDTTTVPSTPGNTDTTTVTGSTITTTAKLDSATATAKAEISTAVISNALTNAAADSKGVKTVEIAISKVEGAKFYEQVLPASVLNQSIKDTKIVIETPIANVIATSNMLGSAGITSGGVASLSVGSVDISTIKDAVLSSIIGNKPVISFDVKVDGQTVSKPLQSSIKLTIPYTPKADEAEKLTVVRINSDGTSTKLGNTVYNKEAGGVTFKSSGTGTYAVVYEPKTFSDLTSYDWAKKQVEVLASKGVINGTSSSTFSPGENITRADFIMVLVNTLDLKASASNSNFADVKSSDYYYNALAIAKELGIAKGSGDNRFNPNEQISRQDMMVICERALNISEMINSQATPKDIENYIDKSLVSNYAVKSVSTMVKEGIVSGQGNNLNPLGNATRAESAVVIYRILSRYIN